ncbi:hypothetical protein ACFQL1_11090 [Halomicroarcula sp. GCM10025709]|uniref:hypothetical protein n=1 Tax=Halomicroarcula sp. GCM10025709 TaxID=3252669 RepID=UPI00361E3DF7
MSGDALRDHLATFGLSEKEIEAYLAVLKAGTATTGRYRGPPMSRRGTSTTSPRRWPTVGW